MNNHIFIIFFFMCRGNIEAILYLRAKFYQQVYRLFKSRFSCFWQLCAGKWAKTYPKIHIKCVKICQKMLKCCKCMTFLVLVYKDFEQTLQNFARSWHLKALQIYSRLQAKLHKWNRAIPPKECTLTGGIIHTCKKRVPRVLPNPLFLLLIFC